MFMTRKKDYEASSLGMFRQVFGQDEPDLNDRDEILLVTKEMADHPLGFVIDAGGSMTKLLYRSKKDYSAGKAIKSCHDPEVGVLRLRNFNMNQVGEVIGFLKENCDINVNPDEDGDEEWWITGVTTQHFKKELDSTLKIKTRLYSETMAIASYLRHFDKMDIGCYETDLEALSYAKRITSVFFGIADVPKEHAEVLSKENIRVQKSENLVLPDEIQECQSLKLFLEGDCKLWAEECLSFSGELEHPSLLVHLGSAGPVALVTEGNNSKFVDFLYGIGKMLSGLAEELTGESDFDKFIEMAERGKLENVDLTTDDVRNEEHDEDDWYRNMPRNLTVFELGKLSSNNFKGRGQFGKEDLAVGVLSAVLKYASKIIFLNARLHKVKSILLGGSLPRYELVRHHFQKHLLTEAIVNNMIGADLVKVHFLKNPGFICSLGVWWENVEKKKAKKQN